LKAFKAPLAVTLKRERAREIKGRCLQSHFKSLAGGKEERERKKHRKVDCMKCPQALFGVGQVNCAFSLVRRIFTAHDILLEIKRGEERRISKKHEMREEMRSHFE
jgi:hypothetical protein